MKVVIIKYNSGNVQSVLFALERLSVQATVTDNAEIIKTADKIIFPGVGEASSAMKYLNEKNLDRLIASLKQPVLGICLGMQLMCKHSEEKNTDCLGIFKTKVKKFTGSLKIPHVGWNKSREIRGEQYYYFVHSYYAELCADTCGITEYGLVFSSVLKKNNFYGVQFHPEKSGKDGEQILKNFLSL